MTGFLSPIHPLADAEERQAAERYAVIGTAAANAGAGGTLEGALDSPTLTRRAYLIARTQLMTGAPWYVCREAVASTAIEHPEWDMLAEKTWDEWEADHPAGEAGQ